MDLVRIISRSKGLRASTIIVDSTNRLQTRGVEILQEGNRIVQDQDSMSLAGQEILEAGLVDRLGNCVDYLLNTVGVLLVLVHLEE